MRPAQVLRPVIACLLLAAGTIHPSSGTGQGLDVPEMRCSLGADSSQVPNSTQAIDTVKFHYYRVPITASKKANRDFEFLWSDTYRRVLRKGLADTLSGSPLKTDIDRLALAVAEERGHNPFGLLVTDLHLAYDFLAQRQVLDSLGNPIVRRSRYDNDPDAPIGLRVAQPSYPDAERTHIDAYIYGRKFSGYGAWPDGWPGDGAIPGRTFNNSGTSPSDYQWPTSEDSTTIGDPGFYPSNSLMIPGPFPSEVGRTDAARWTRPGGRANADLVHESLHAINFDFGRNNTYLHMFASGAEAVTGASTDPPLYDLAYRTSLSPGPGGDTSAYPLWQSFMAYLIFNFRGADTTAAGYLDDLVPRWAKRDVGELSLPGLGRRLRDVECPECDDYAGFAGIDSLERVQRLIHDWRVASYVNNDTLRGGHYGFPAGYGFSPALQLGAWQGIDNDPANDWAAAPPEIVLGATDRGRTRWITEDVRSTPSDPRKLALRMWGAEYFVVRAGSGLAATQQTLHARVRLPKPLKAAQLLGQVGNTSGVCQNSGWSGRVHASLVTYSASAESLFRHPGWATSVTTLSSVFDSVRRDLEFEVPGFGSSTQAAVVVLTLSDGPEWYYSQPGRGSLTDTCEVELAISLVPAGVPVTPVSVAATANVEAEPAWSPDGTKLAFRGVDGSGISRVFSVASIGSGTPTPLNPAATGQFEPSWSPRGDAVAYAQQTGPNRHLWTVNPASGAAQQLTAMTGAVRMPAFAPDGGRIAYVRMWEDSGAVRWDVRVRDIGGSGDALLTSFEGDSAIVGLRWSPDGRRLLFTRYDEADELRHLYQLHVSTLDLTTHDALAPAAWLGEFAPGAGDMLVEEQSGLPFIQGCEFPAQLPPAYGGCNCEPGVALLPAHWIALRDTLAGISRPIAYRTGAEFSQPRFSPDGTKVAYVTTQNGNPDIYIAPVTFDRAPAFTSATTYYLIPDCEPFDLPLSATDADGDPLTREVFDLPAGAVLQPDGTLHWESPVLGHHWIIARALDPQGAVASRVIHLDVVPGGGCGGGGGEGGDEPPILPGGGNSARQAEASRLIGGTSGPLRAANTFLDGAASGAWTAQVARLVAAQSDSTGLVRSQFVALRPGQFRLDRARLLVVDHAPGTVAVAAGGDVTVGRKHRPASLSASGEDLTAALTVGADAARLLPAGTTIAVRWNAADSIAGLVVDCARAGAAGAAGAWGLRLDVEHEGLWQVVGRIHPRSAYDALAVALPPGAEGPLRLVCESDTYVREIAGYSLASAGSEAATVTAVEVGEADIEGAVANLAAADSAAVELTQGGRLTMHFAGPAPEAGRQRTLFLDLVAAFTPEGGVGAMESRTVEAAPARFALHGNRPNPFGGGTTIRFDVPIATRVKLEVFDAQGRRVRVLADGAYAPGEHTLAWDGTDAGGARVRPGVYLYRMSAGSFREQRRMVLLGR